MKNLDLKPWDHFRTHLERRIRLERLAFPEIVSTPESIETWQKFTWAAGSACAKRDPENQHRYLEVARQVFHDHFFKVNPSSDS